MASRNCIQCNEEIIGKPDNRKFCCDDCRNTYYHDKRKIMRQGVSILDHLHTLHDSQDLSCHTNAVLATDILKIVADYISSGDFAAANRNMGQLQ